MASDYKGTRDIKKLHYNMGILLTNEKKEEILKNHFKKRVGYDLDFENPKTYNEKVMWSKLYYQNPLITKCCDKYAVKDYVKEVIGEEYIVPTIAAWDNPDDIDFDKLPDQFVLKVNWSSGYNIVVKDKSKLDIEGTRAKLRQWMKPDRNSYYQFFNWGYKHMKPVVYAEEYLEQIAGQVYDYKFFAFNSEVKALFIATERNTKGSLTFDFFDRDFNYMPFTYGGTHHADPLPEKPKHYEKMIQLAEKLAKPFPFVRVDFYEVGDRIYLGEMTFYSGGGLLSFDPIEWDYKFGEWYQLPEKTIIDKDPAFLKTRILFKKGTRKIKRGVRKLRGKLIRHDVIQKQHYLTLFNGIRFSLEPHSENGYKYVTINGVQLKYKREAIKNADGEILMDPEFEMLPPKMAYMMEDKITMDMKKHYCEQKAYKQMKYFPNLDNPKSFNEKLLWLALNYKNPHHAVASDKARAKDWIGSRIGYEYVVPLIGAYSNVNDINFDKLPEKFVMKANEGWGADQVIIVDGKDKFNEDYLKAHASSWLYPWSSYYYNNMCITDEKPERPLVVIEEYLEHEGDKYLEDYKFYCCNGKMKFALVVADRSSRHQTRTFVDADWNVLPVRRAGKISNVVPEKPKNYEKMVELAEILSAEVPFVRIDFYNLDGQIYVGEMTFTPGLFLRLEPREWDFRLGEYLDLTDAMKEMEALKKKQK